MKPIVIFIACLVLIPSRVKAQTASEDSLWHKLMPWNIGRVIDDYYYTYFEYPHDLGDLEHYLWSSINYLLANYVIEPVDENEITNSQYQDFVTCGHSFMNTLKYLKYNERYITIEKKNGSLDLRCLRDGLMVNYTADICWDLENFEKANCFGEIVAFSFMIRTIK